MDPVISANELVETSWSGTAAAGLGLLGLGLLLWRRQSLQGTTLMAAWYWAVLSLTTIAGCEVVVGLLGAGQHPAWVEPLRFAAAVSTFCPFMAVLGAKRPQHRAWQFIVLSLWAILVLPAGESYFLRPDGALLVHDARAWFLLILIAVGLLDRLPTRFALASVFFSSGQIALLSGYLPLLRKPLGTAGVLIGLALIVSGLALSRIASRRRRKAVWPADQIWLDFRDLFGLLWGLRICQRFNVWTDSSGYNITLTWNGFQVSSTDGQPGEFSTEILAGVHSHLQFLFRRFVSPEWIAERESYPFSVVSYPLSYKERPKTEDQ